MAKAKTLQTPWYDKTVKALQLAGMGDRTQECLGRKRPLFEYLKAQKEIRLLSVLTPEEVRLILSQVLTFHNDVFLVTVFWFSVVSVANFLNSIAGNPRLYAKATGLSRNLAENASHSIWT